MATGRCGFAEGRGKETQCLTSSRNNFWASLRGTVVRKTLDLLRIFPSKRSLCNPGNKQQENTKITKEIPCLILIKEIRNGLASLCLKNNLNRFFGSTVDDVNRMVTPQAYCKPYSYLAKGNDLKTCYVVLGESGYRHYASNFSVTSIALQSVRTTTVLPLSDQVVLAGLTLSTVGKVAVAIRRYNCRTSLLRAMC